MTTTNPNPNTSPNATVAAEIAAYQAVPTIVQVVHVDGTAYAVGRLFDALTSDQKLKITKVDSIYQSDEGVYVFFVKPGSQGKNPVTPLLIPTGQCRGLVLSFDAMAAEMCELVKRRHFAMWVSRWNSFYAAPETELEDDDGDDGDGDETETFVNPDDLDSIPIDELMASVARQLARSAARAHALTNIALADIEPRSSGPVEIETPHLSGTEADSPEPGK